MVQQKYCYSKHTVNDVSDWKSLFSSWLKTILKPAWLVLLLMAFGFVGQANAQDDE